MELKRQRCSCYLYPLVDDNSIAFLCYSFFARCWPEGDHNHIETGGRSQSNIWTSTHSACLVHRCIKSRLVILERIFKSVTSESRVRPDQSRACLWRTDVSRCNMAFTGSPSSTQMPPLLLLYSLAAVDLLQCSTLTDGQYSIRHCARHHDNDIFRYSILWRWKLTHLTIQLRMT